MSVGDFSEDDQRVADVAVDDLLLALLLGDDALGGLTTVQRLALAVVVNTHLADALGGSAAFHAAAAARRRDLEALVGTDAAEVAIADAVADDALARADAVARALA